MELGTIWHEKVNGDGFHSKGISCKPQLYLQRVQSEISGRKIIPFFGKL